MNEEQKFALKFLLDAVGGEYPSCEDILREMLDTPTAPLVVAPTVPARMQFRYEGDKEWRDVIAREGVVDVGIEHRYADAVPVEQRTVQATEAQWHAPGLGEVHARDHSYMIYCSKDAGDDEIDNEIADDELAKFVCSVLNANSFQPGNA